VPAAVVVVMAAPVVDVAPTIVPAGGNVVTTERVVPAGIPVVLTDVAPGVVPGGTVGTIGGTGPAIVPGNVPGTVPGKVPRVVGLAGGTPDVTPAAAPPRGFPVDSKTTKSPPAAIMAFVLSLIVPGAARPMEASMFFPVDRVKTKISLPPLEEVMLPVRRVEVDWKATNCPFWVIEAFWLTAPDPFEGNPPPVPPFEPQLGTRANADRRRRHHPRRFFHRPCDMRLSRQGP
jgi:hypothetical protein